MVGDMHGRGCAWWGLCMAGGHAWQGECMACVADIINDRVNERTVHILLECILVVQLLMRGDLKLYPSNCQRACVQKCQHCQICVREKSIRENPIPSATVSISGGGVCLRGVSAWGVSAQWGCLPRGCLPRGMYTSPIYRHIATCKNITFPQLLLRTIKILPLYRPKFFMFCFRTEADPRFLLPWGADI